MVIVIFKIMEVRTDEIKGSNKINYRQKNLEYIQKLKERKQRDLDDKILQEKKQMQRRQNLKRKILEEATKTRQNKLRELDDNGDEFRSRNSRTGTNFQSLPKIPNQKERQEEGEKKNYQQRYLTFLQGLHQANRSKKEIEEAETKKKEDRVKKIRDEMGYTNIEGRLKTTKLRKQSSENMDDSQGLDLARSHSADKFQSLIQIAQNQLPRTNKNFKRKNEEYIQKIKKRKADKQQEKQQKRMKEQRLKQKLKEYVMVTVKKNVLDGMYDQQLDRKAKKTVKESQDDFENREQQESQKDEIDSPRKKKRKMRSFPYVTDLVEWKKKNRLEDGQKVFIITGGYNELKLALMERGWVRNPDYNSPCFDYKFSLQQREIDFDHLHDFQMVNHFQKNGVITTKVGLTKSLRSSVWVNDVSEDNYYPKCFDLNDQDDYVAFETHFKVCKALSILKIYVDSSKNRKEQKFKKDKGLLQDLKMRTQVALSVCSKNIEDLDDIIDKKKVPKIVTQKQWQILAIDELNAQGLAKKKHQEWLKSIDCKFGSVGVTQTVKKDGKQKKKKKKKQKTEIEQNQQEIDEQEQDIEDELLDKVKELLEDYNKRFVQYHLTGHNNIWILKPAGLSRGRGITCKNNFVQIYDHVKCKQSLWIAQKYIENPLVILRRKFDIRLWVLITDFNPLIVWIYDECYIRFSAIDYDPKQVNNKFIHLTNAAIGTKSKQFQKSPIKGNMFFEQQFQEYLIEKQGRDVFTEKIKPQFKDIVKKSMMCAIEGVQNRKNSHEMYGYDFMVDENYEVWLIEINSSPSMDYSTRVTSKLVKEVLNDVPKVVVDYAYAPKKERKHVDTGKWKKIHKGQQVADKTATAGLNLCLEGIPMKKPAKRQTVKVQNFSLDKQK